MGTITLAHWIYIAVILAVIVGMVFRRDVVVFCLIGILLIGINHTGSLIGGMQVVFKALMAAGTEFFNIILIFALMLAMLKSLQPMGADKLMVSPAKAIMKSPASAFFALSIITYIAALFFWPTPAMVLLGPILVPVAVSVGLPAIGAAMAVNIMANGMALSGDLVLQGAPKLTSTAAGVDIISSLTNGGILSVVAGVTAITIAYLMIRKDIVLIKDKNAAMETASTAETFEKTKIGLFFAIAVPVILAIIIVIMVTNKIVGGESTALLGGTAVLILIVATFVQEKDKALEKTVEYIRDGFLFSIKVFAPVIPVIGFFFLGGQEVAMILGEDAPKLLFDIGNVAASAIPLNKFALYFGNLIIGLISGLDGSGFSGLPLVGGLAGSLGGPAGIDVSGMAAVGQMGAIWSGGGTLVSWAFGLCVAAGVANVSPLDLARRNFVPVLIGLVVATIFAIIFI